MGLFADDTRFLSRWVLTINGAAAAPALVGQGGVLLGSLLPPQPDRGRPRAGRALDRAGPLHRRRHAGAHRRPEPRPAAASSSSSRSRSAPTSLTSSPSRSTTSRSGTRTARRRFPELAPAEFEPDGNQFVFVRRAEAATQVLLSEPGEVERGLGSLLHRAGAAARVAPPDRRHPVRRRRARRRRARRSGGSATSSRASARRSRRGTSRVPQLRASWDAARRTVQSNRSPTSPRSGWTRTRASRPASGGGDAVVHDRLRPRHAHHVPADAPLRAGARAQRAACRSPSCRRPRTTRRSTPSPARSSTRCGTARAPRPGSRATTARVDATPLYLVLLSEVWRWTDDAALVRELREPALRALDWIDEFGDLDGDGFVEYRRRSERGLVNQSWKDSGDSQRFHDGRIAEAPIAPVRGAGLRLRRQAAHGRARPRGLARPRSSPSGSKRRRRSCGRVSTRRSGARSAAATTRSRSTARRAASTR